MSSSSENPQISVAEFVEKSPDGLEIEIVAGAGGLRRKTISSERIQKIGLALAGFSNYIRAGRIQIVGQSEISYLAQLSAEQRIAALQNLDLEKICCILITRNLAAPEELKRIGDAHDLPVLRTKKVSSATIAAVSKFLQIRLAPHITLHGVLMEIYGLGVLIKGASGIGKSESALDLIARGHRLISDDAVILKKIGDALEGSAPELTVEHLEIRGLGILNVREHFGVAAIGQPQPIKLVIELKKWHETGEIERLGLDRQEEDLLGIKVGKFVLPVSAGRNISTLIETAVRVHLLRGKGFDAAQKLIEKHSAMLRENI